MQLQTIKLQEHILIQTFGRFVNCTVNYMNKVSTSHKWMKDWFQFIYCSKLLREGSPETLRPLFKIFSRSSLKKWGKRRELGCTINYVFWGPIETTGPPEQRQKVMIKIYWNIRPAVCSIPSLCLKDRGEAWAAGQSMSEWQRNGKQKETNTGEVAFWSWPTKQFWFKSPTSVCCLVQKSWNPPPPHHHRVTHTHTLTHTETHTHAHRLISNAPAHHENKHFQGSSLAKWQISMAANWTWSCTPL